MQPGAVTSNIGETGNNNVALPADSIRTSLAKIIHGRAVASLTGAMPTRDFARQVVMAVLCCAVLCCAVLCCAVLCFASSEDQLRGGQAYRGPEMPAAAYER